MANKRMNKPLNMHDNGADGDMEYEESLTKYPLYTHASHVMIYSVDYGMYTHYKRRANILMQMRFDGQLGFPGGLVDPGECPIEALNRELIEEVGATVSSYHVGRQNHIITNVNHLTQLVTHFFTLEVGLNSFCDIERGVLSCVEYGNEVLGIIRPPLYTMDDGKKGLPTFLTNSFAGTARDQLLHGLVHSGILTQKNADLVKDISNTILHEKVSGNILNR